MATLDDLVEALYAADHDEGATKATSLRLPTAVHRATAIATELGMARSFTAATTEALLDRLRGFARQRAIAEHLVRFPGDQPSLTDVVRRRVAGTDHPALNDPRTTDRVAIWFEQRHPDWARSGQVDAAVDQVLEHLELLMEPAGPAGGSVASGGAIPRRRAGSIQSSD